MQQFFILSTVLKGIYPLTNGVSWEKVTYEGMGKFKCSKMSTKLVKGSQEKTLFIFSYIKLYLYLNNLLEIHCLDSKL